MACAVCMLCAATAIAAPAQVFTLLHSFSWADGSHPSGPLVQATDGNLYGTTTVGGTHGGGTVFKISSSGELTTLYNFCSRQPRCMDGASSYGGLIQAGDGNFYGTTSIGGANDNSGTIFKMTPTGKLTTLYSFCSQSGCTDGATPEAALVQATDGLLYGTTFDGGANGFGTVFKITPDGTLTTIYSFCSQAGCADGQSSYTALVQATDGNLYGTTYQGGANGDGTVFKITTSGSLTTLHSFDFTDGRYPGTLVQASDGNLYGTTGGGGVNGDAGTAFKITLGGTLTTLYNFCSQDGCTDGSEPAGLVEASDGNFYGSTFEGGSKGGPSGTVFRLATNGTLTTLRSFGFDSANGSNPNRLVQDTNGSFYATTYEGGNRNACNYGCGTVFSLSVGLGPFVETQPTSGKVGAAIKILGTNLTGATSVTFNGTAAIFKVDSASLITTTVPVGATSGKVQVVTAGGTLTSNVPFRVRP